VPAAINNFNTGIGFHGIIVVQFTPDLFRGKHFIISA